MTAQEIEDAGFLWPVETEIENHLGERRRVKPLSLKDGFDTATKRQREDFRLYNDGASEHELKMWQIGDPTVIFNTFGAIKPVLARGNITEAEVVRAVKEQGFHDLQIEYTLGWLKDGGYVTLNPQTGYLVDNNPADPK